MSEKNQGILPVIGGIYAYINRHGNKKHWLCVYYGSLDVEHSDEVAAYGLTTEPNEDLPNDINRVYISGENTSFGFYFDNQSGYTKLEDLSSIPTYVDRVKYEELIKVFNTERKVRYYKGVMHLAKNGYQKGLYYTGGIFEFKMTDVIGNSKTMRMIAFGRKSVTQFIYCASYYPNSDIVTFDAIPSYQLTDDDIKLIGFIPVDLFIYLERFILLIDKGHCGNQIIQGINDLRFNIHPYTLREIQNEVSKL